jgi:serine/threonine protein phosphatase PrpC
MIKLLIGINNQNNQGDNIDHVHSTPQQTLFDINEDLRRIYECGGEIRKLAGEEKSRIFVKGKYFPGLINTRSLGDQIGCTIGTIYNPHISKYTFDDKSNYYMIMCTDGITNVQKIDQIVTTIENHDGCKL